MKKNIYPQTIKTHQLQKNNQQIIQPNVNQLQVIPQMSFSEMPSSIKQQEQKSVDQSNEFFKFQSNHEEESQVYSSRSLIRNSSVQLTLLVISKIEVGMIMLNPGKKSNGKYKDFFDQQVPKDNQGYSYYFHHFSEMESAETYQLKIKFGQKMKPKQQTIIKQRNKSIKIMCFDEELNIEKNLAPLKIWNSFIFLFSNLIAQDLMNKENIKEMVDLFHITYEQTKFPNPDQINEFIKFPGTYSQEYLQFFILILCTIVDNPYTYIPFIGVQENLVKLLPQIQKYNKCVGQLNGIDPQHPQNQYLNAIYSIILLILKQQIPFDNDLAIYYFFDLLKSSLSSLQQQILKQLFSNKKVQDIYHTFKFDDFFSLLQQTYQIQKNLYIELLSSYYGCQSEKSCDLSNLLSIVNLHDNGIPLPKNFSSILQNKKKQYYFSNQLCSYDLAVQIKDYQQNSQTYKFLLDLINQKSITFMVDQRSSNSFHASYHHKAYYIYTYIDKYPQDDIKNTLISKWEQFPKYYFNLNGKSQQIIGYFRTIICPFNFEALQHFFKCLRQRFQSSSITIEEKQKILKEMKGIFMEQGKKNYQNQFIISQQLANLMNR